MEDRISVCLTGPAKIDGRWRKPGEDVAVTTDMVRELAAAGVIPAADADAVADLASGMPGFDEAVRAAAKELAVDAVEAATAELVAVRDAALARATEAEAQRDLLQARVTELQAEVAALQRQNTEGGERSDAGQETAPQEKPVEPAPKNTRKKGAGANQG